MYAPRYEEAFLPYRQKRPHYEEFFCIETKNNLGCLLPTPCLITTCFGGRTAEK